MLKNFWNKLRPVLFGNLAYAVGRILALTLRVRMVNDGPMEEHISQGKGAVLVTWHGRTLIPANLYRGRKWWAMISLSRDGEIQDIVFRRFGFQTIRGSSRRGGIRAALEAARKVREGGVLAFTPDGPRGPTHKVQGGTLLIAQKSGCPIFPAGIAAAPRKLMRSWDRYLVPLPFARACFIYGEAITVPPDADEAEMARIAGRLEEAMNRLEEEAEANVLGSPAEEAHGEQPQP
jgi:lysophospholipid acyltransferase (LPLAT)-like uncharacterized protein